MEIWVPVEVVERLFASPEEFFKDLMDEKWRKVPVSGASPIIVDETPVKVTRRQEVPLCTDRTWS